MGVCANSNLIFNSSEGELRVHAEYKNKQVKQSMSVLCKSTYVALTFLTNIKGVDDSKILFIILNT